MYICLMAFLLLGGNPAPLQLGATKAPLNTTVWRPAKSPKAVLFFLPGLRREVRNYSLLAEGLAERGFLVIGLDPQSNRAVVDQQNSAAELLKARQALGQSEHAKLPVGYWGHSLGGAAAMLAAGQATDETAVANLDGDFMGTALAARPRGPLLLVNNEEPDAPKRTQDRRTHDWALVSSRAKWRWRVKLPGTRHMNFSDLAIGAEPDGTRFGPVDAKQAIQETVHLLDGFFTEHLLGVAGATKKSADGFLELPLP